MDKQGLKSRYHRFRQWQEQPFNYQRPTDEVHHCNNCGEDFTGNFCPVCSQTAGMGRIGWRSVHQGIMDIWGLGTRSLLYSIWQLLLRPGHIISDYIDGKRQVSFPPVKMLFIIAVIYSMVYYWLLPTIFEIQVEPVITPEDQVIMGDMVSWLETNYSWFALIMALLAVLPTWVMFRYSPRHTLHTLPEGFFIQIFLAVMMIVFSFLLIPIAMIDVMLYTVIVYCVYGIYYIIVYHYLFGYGIWGTLWRSGFVLLTVILLMSVGTFLASNFELSLLAKGINKQLTKEDLLLIKMVYAGGTLIAACVVLAFGFVINYFVTSKDRKMALQNTYKER